MIRPLSLSILLVACAGIAACRDAPSEDALTLLERELAEDGSDPAVAAALADPIMTDTALAARHNAAAIRPPSAPYAAPIPMPDVAARGSTADLIARETLTAAPAATGDGCPDCVAARRAPTLAAAAAPVIGRCSDSIDYSNGWATRLPAAIPMIPDTRVSEAAGIARGSCDVRIVRFWSDLPPDRTIDWVFTRASAAGQRVDRAADALGSRIDGRARDGSRYRLFIDPRPGGGSDLLLVTLGPAG